MKDSTAEFAASLKAYLEGQHAASPTSGREMLDFLNKPPSQHKTRVLRRMERRARNELGLAANEAIDWQALDWTAIISTLLPILLKILMLFVAL